MRKLLLAGAVAVLLAAGVPAALAATGSGSSSLDLQASEFTTTAVSKTGTVFSAVPGLSGLAVCAAGQVTATVSMQLNGAPAGLQVLVDGGPVMDPGAVRFVPAGPYDSSSFTFTKTVSAFENNDHHTFDVQWRAPAGGTAHLVRGTVSLAYQKGTHGC